MTTPAEGSRVQQLYTTREFPGNFTLKLEFRATPNADSGVFIRKPQLQCRDYPLAGPYKTLKNYKAGDWNELIVVVKDGVPIAGDLADWVKARLRSTKTPDVWSFRDALPYNDTGKLLRRQLKVEMGAVGQSSPAT